MNHETQLDLRLAGSKEFGLLLKLILCTSFEVIIGFLCPFNRRIRFQTQFHSIVSLLEKTFQTPNKQGCAERKLLHVKMSSGTTYAVRRRCTRPRAIPLALTKISRIDRLPFFLTHGALRAAPLKKTLLVNPLPLPRTKIYITKRALEGYTKSFKVIIKSEKDPLEQLQSTREGIEKKNSKHY